MKFVQDSIMREKEDKDSTILGFVSTMNEIQENLDSIRKIEAFVKLQTLSGPELNTDARKSILDDVELIHELLQKNKDLVMKLQEELDSSNSQISGLQKTILYLNKQIKEKDNQIAQLVGELDKLQLNVAGLNRRIRQAEQERLAKEEIIASQSKEIEEQVAEMNTAFYIFGKLKDLVENGVVEKEGGVLGIGRTAKLRTDFNSEVFTQVDIRELEAINLNARKAEVVTTHDVNSFKLVGEQRVDSLKIIDANKFWEASKYLVVVVN